MKRYYAIFLAFICIFVIVILGSCAPQPVSEITDASLAETKEEGNLKSYDTPTSEEESTMLETTTTTTTVALQTKRITTTKATSDKTTTEKKTDATQSIVTHPFPSTTLYVGPTNEYGLPAPTPRMLACEKARMKKTFCELDAEKITQIEVDRAPTDSENFLSIVTDRETISAWIDLVQKIKMEPEAYELRFGSPLLISFIEDDTVVCHCSFWGGENTAMFINGTLAQFRIANYEELKDELQAACAMVDKDLKFSLSS
jgi:hypothetical protein